MSDTAPIRVPAWFEAELIAVRPRLLRYCHTLHRGAPEAAEDLAQEALIRAIKHHRSYQRGTNMFGWVCHIAKNLRVSLSRVEWRTVQTSTGDIEDWMFPVGAEHAGPARLALAETQDALAGLPPEMCDAVIRISLGQSYEEAAGVLGIAIGTVKSRACRGRAALREALA